jgi:hypothetical protein
MMGKAGGKVGVKCMEFGWVVDRQHRVARGSQTRARPVCTRKIRQPHLSTTNHREYELLSDAFAARTYLIQL